MQLQKLVAVLIVIVASLCLAQARPSSGPLSENGRRVRRQSHPESTVAVFPESSGGGEKEPLLYLVPPEEAAGPLGKNDDWEAGELLAPPPPPQGSETYRTIKEPPPAEEQAASASDQLPAQPPLDGSFSFVKTDKEGHFTWGVRHNRP